MKIKIKRIYDKPEKSDGRRILVDRLWPRGISKSKAGVDAWLKDVAPSNDLRKWFHIDPEERWSEFRKRYSVELKKNQNLVEEDFPSKGTVTLVTAAKNPLHSHAVILKDFLEAL